MNTESLAAPTRREPVLSPVDRISELLFGLFMLEQPAAISAAETTSANKREVFIAGLLLAWRG